MVWWHQTDTYTTLYIDTQTISAAQVQECVVKMTSWESILLCLDNMIHATLDMLMGRVLPTLAGSGTV